MLITSKVNKKNLSPCGPRPTANNPRLERNIHDNLKKEITYFCGLFVCLFFTKLYMQLGVVQVAVVLVIIIIIIITVLFIL